MDFAEALSHRLGIVGLSIAALQVFTRACMAVLPVRSAGDGSFIRSRGGNPIVSIGAVGFDLDDTLCTPERNRKALLTDAVASVDAPGIGDWASREAYQDAHRAHLTSDTRRPVFEAMLDRAEIDADPTELAAVYRRQVNEALRPLDGLRSLLRELRGRYRVGLLTNGPSRAQRSKLETLGLTEAFDGIFISGELVAGKPDTRAFDSLVNGLGVSPNALVYVGDDVAADIEGATAAGCQAIQVMHEDSLDPDPRAVAHIRYAELVDDLPGILAHLE